MSPTRKLIAGNWKMNGLSGSLAEVRALLEGLEAIAAPREIENAPEIVVCPPGLLAGRVGELLSGTRVVLGGQDCHARPSGAYTGDISAEMWADAGARYVIVGHSERRAGHGETDAMVQAKAEAVLRAGMRPIICLGETLEERDAGRTLDVITRQLAASLPAAFEQPLVVAYEPIWAIGTGRTPTLAEVKKAHGALRAGLRDRAGEGAAGQIPLLYGGSVKPDNAAELLAVDDVDGALVGGASLKAVDFLAIIRAGC